MQKSLEVEAKDRKKRLAELLKKKKAEKQGSKNKKEAEKHDDEDQEEQEASEANNGEEYLDGRQLAEQVDNELDEDEPVARRVERKHLLKHFNVKKRIECWYTGGALHFCKDGIRVYAQFNSSVVRYNMSERRVEYTIDHVSS